MARSIQVGIIGASASGGWARDSHVPAVQGLPGLDLAAVATNSLATAKRAAAEFGVAKAYGSGLDLIRDPDIDMVTVATRVPDHRDLVLAALAAGKHVYCEWPLGRGSAEAVEMAKAALSAKAHTAIGLQLRSNPAVHKARALIGQGAIGRLLSVSASTATAGFGPDVPAPFLYLEGPLNFANLVTIQGAHTLDLALSLTGPLQHLSALATAQYPTISAGEDRAPQHRLTSDHLVVQALSAGGGSLSIEVAGGRPPQTASWIEAVGEAGTIRLEGGAARGIQAGSLKLLVNGVEEPCEAALEPSMPEAALNVAETYRFLLDDILQGTSTAVGFDHAVRLTRLMEAVFESSRTGRRIPADEWPERRLMRPPRPHP